MSTRPMTGHRRARTLIAGILALILLASGCGRFTTDAAGSDPKNPTIGVSVYNMTSFITLGREGAQREADALGAEMLWRSANNDVNNQVAQLQTFINQRVDAIVIAPVNSSTLAPQIEAAEEAGIPVFVTNLTVDRPQADLTKAYIGPDDVAAGAQAFRSAAERIEGKGNVVLLQGPLGQSGEIDRTTGVERALRKYPDITLLAKQTANWDRNEAYNVMNNWLSAHGGKIDAVVAENDDMAIGAIRSLATRDLVGKVPVTGVDGIEDGLDLIQKGQISATNLQNAPLELGLAIAVAVRQIRGEPYPKKALIDMPVVDSRNVDEIMRMLFTERERYLRELPKLIEENLETGDYGRLSLDTPTKE